MAITVTINGGSPITINQQSVSPTTVNLSAASAVNVSVVGATGPAGPAGADGADGAAGQGVPTGGFEGQVILKQSATDYDTAWDYVESVYAPIENNEGSVMSAGTPVYAKGISGNRILVGAACANDTTKMPAIGILLEETADGATGEIITAGLFNKTVTGLTGVSIGDTVYVTNAGTLGVVRPTAATDGVQNIGVVLQTNGSNIQKMKVSAIDRVNDIPNLASGVFFIGGATGQLSPYTLPIADGTANQFLKTDGAGAVTFTSITQATGNELENVVEDTTPQLGGTLDSNGNEIRFRGTGHTNYVAIAPSTLEPASSVTFYPPIADGTTGQVIQTNGSGRLSFTDQTDTTYTAGDGLDLAGTEFSADLKANGGIVVESTELAVDLGASSITGTLDIADGGTGQTTQQAALDAVTNASSGTTGQVLTTDGTNASWQDASGGSSGYKMLQTYSYSDTGTTDKFFVQTATTELSGTNAARDYRSAFAVPIAGSIGDCTMMGGSAVNGNAYRLYVWVNNTSTYYAEATGGDLAGGRYTVRWTSWKNVSDDSTASDPSFSANDYLAFQLVPTGVLANPGSVSLAVLTSHT